MPITSGTSFIGLQRLGSQPAANIRNLAILLPTSNRARRTVRMGTVLLTFSQPDDSEPVGAVWKLYGEGMSVVITPAVPNADASIWVNWFVRPIAWQLITSDPN